MKKITLILTLMNFASACCVISTDSITPTKLPNDPRLEKFIETYMSLSTPSVDILHIYDIKYIEEPLTARERIFKTILTELIVKQEIEIDHQQMILRQVKRIE